MRAVVAAVPLVCADAAATPEYFSGIAKFYRPKDETAFQTALQSALATEREQLEQKAAIFAARYSETSVLDEYSQLYEDVLGNREMRPRNGGSS